MCISGCSNVNNVCYATGLPELVAAISDTQTVTRPPAQRGSQAYVQFVANLKRIIAPVYDQKIRRFFFSCLRHLEVSTMKTSSYTV